MNKRKIRHIVICGGIAVGKSTLCLNLGKTIRESTPILEIPSNNVFLSDFYNDQKRWGFHSRIGMLSLLLKSYVEQSNASDIVIFDRSVHELIVFARLQYKLGNLTKREYNLYLDLYKSIVSTLKPVDLFLYLHCSTEVSMARIALRGRDFERKIGAEYIDAVSRQYAVWLKANHHRHSFEFIDTTEPINVPAIADMLKRRFL